MNENMPIVGIVAKYSEFRRDAWNYYEIVEQINQMLNKYDMIPVGLMSLEKQPSFKTDDNAPKTQIETEAVRRTSALLSRLDGVVLQGGMSTNAYEIAIAKHCIEAEIPLLGICSGFNNIVRALGGSVIHLPTALHKQLIFEEDGSEDDFTLHERAHRIIVKPETELFRVLKKQLDDNSTIWVNSSHEYVAAADDIYAPGIVAAICPDDGTVEAIEVRNKGFVMGVKWHPELASNMTVIFEAFAKACREYRYDHLYCNRGL